MDFLAWQQIDSPWIVVCCQHGFFTVDDHFYVLVAPENDRGMGNGSVVEGNTYSLGKDFLGDGVEVCCGTVGRCDDKTVSNPFVMERFVVDAEGEAERVLRLLVADGDVIDAIEDFVVNACFEERNMFDGEFSLVKIGEHFWERNVLTLDTHFTFPYENFGDGGVFPLCEEEGSIAAHRDDDVRILLCDGVAVFPHFACYGLPVLVVVFEREESDVHVTQMVGGSLRMASMMLMALLMSLRCAMPPVV